MEVALAGAPSTGGSTGFQGFQGLEGQWNGWLFTSSAAPVADVCLEAVLSSSDDSFLAEAVEGATVGAAIGLVTERGASSRIIRSGDQPGGRRRLI